MYEVVEYRTFTESDVPLSLALMLRDLRRDRDRKGILTKESQGALKALGLNPVLHEWIDEDTVVDPTGARAQRGTPPQPDVAARLVENAKECERRNHPEASWNCSVHWPLLDEAIRNAGVNTHIDVGTRISFLNSTTASLIPGYAPVVDGTVFDKRVDFCCFIDLKNHPSALKSLRAVITAPDSPYHHSINHTNHESLLDRPICLSIETKKTGEDWKDCVSKMSSWFAAQWKRLSELTNKSGMDSSDIFLPGFIIQGHDWHFIAATHNKDNQTILWGSEILGSTRDLQGVYQLSAAIQRLVDWSARIYWPWLRKAALLGPRLPAVSASGGTAA